MPASSSSASRPVANRPRQIVAGALAVAAVVAAAWFLLRKPIEKPHQLGAASTRPERIKRQGGLWYWVQRDKNANLKLMCADESGVRTFADSLAAAWYAVDGESIAWITKAGQKWSVQVSGVGVAAPRILWAGDEEPLGLALGGGRAVWLRRVPPTVSGGSPFPPLSASLEVVAVPLAGGSATSFARLWEPDGEVLGAKGEALYVAAYRRATPGTLSLYRVPFNGDAPTRLVGEQGNPNALLSRKGDLYWLAPSRESTSAYCVRRLGTNDRPEIVTDWLPPGGTLYETDSGLMLNDEAASPALWPVTRPDVLPEPLRLPEGYVALAAGEGEMLLASFTGAPAGVPLYQVRLP